MTSKNLVLNPASEGLLMGTSCDNLLQNFLFLLYAMADKITLVK